MRKILLFSLIFLFFYTKNYAQVKGNVNYQQEESSGNFYKQRAQSVSPYSNSRVKTSNDQNNIAVANNPEYNAVTLDAKILINVKPDKLMAVFSLLQAGETATEVDKMANDRLNGFSNELQKIGVSTANIFVDMISLVPVFEIEVEKRLFSKSYNEVPKGFELQKNIHILIDEESKLHQIMTIASNYEIYDIIKVDYIVQDINKVQAQLQTEAINVIQAKLEKMKKLGVDFNSPYKTMSEESAVTYPTERYLSHQASSASLSIDVQKKRGTVQRIRKPIIQYYNKVSENGFDLVVNPQVLAPVVQFSYQLKVRYPIDRPTPTKEVYFITPNGEMKLLPK